MSREMILPDIKYLTINDKDINFGLTVTTIGYQSIAPHSRYPSKGHPSGYWFNPQAGRSLQEYQLIYITNGKGKFSSRHAQAVEVAAGTVMLLFPNEWHTYTPSQETGWNTYWIGFKGPFANHFLQHNFFNKESPVHHVGFNEQLVKLFRDIIDLSAQGKTGFQQVISAITLHILGLVYYIIKNNAFSNKEILTKIEKARLMMREHPHGEISSEELAQSLNMSYSWFRKMFKQYTGLAPAQYQQQLKTQKAREWLMGSDKAIKEIACILNFESVNYFNSFFKQKTGITPAKFREGSHLKI